jgi:S-(hydroxymethyl)glutathione dehydrogenase / alcohol dehydrogenase
MKVKAAIQYEYHKPLTLEEVELEDPGPHDVMIKMAACAICHSDVHCKHGEHGIVPLPGIGGHEISGYIEKIGSEVTYVKPGDLVIATIIPAGCGKCYYCSIGQSNMCTTNRLALFQPGHFITKKGQRVLNFEGPVAGFAEYTTVPEVNVIKVPSGIKEDVACLVACGVISGFGGMLNRAKAQPHKSALVIGTGGVGLNAIQGAAYIGCYPIVAVDILDSKLETAKKFGATHTMNSKNEKDPVKKAWELTDGRGADYVVVSVAGINILRQGFMMSATAGTTCVIGHGTGEKLEAFGPTDFMAGRSLTGSAMGAVKSRIEIPRIFELYKIGKIKLDELIDQRYPFDKINDAISDMEKGGVVRNVVMF